ncbi:hypothetical protein EW145_g3299 [Phellinidium pouzarii]|uniref:Uncharacterized protein n=1 Tax=Phellinidium pouzarii TaxID=167371 RepID=A0A4S4L849_9AGAM|nr:hypothetical protein EW145_g3299 [Phellinidium pouzarii]
MRVPSDSPLIVNAVNPDYCLTDLFAELRDNGFIFVLLWLSLVLVARPTEEGGCKLMHVAVTTDLLKALGKEELKDTKHQETKWG